MQPQETGVTELLANLSIGYVVLAALVLTCLRLVLVPNRSVIARSAAELIESLLVAGVLVFLIIRPFFVQAFYIPSESMEPTLLGHEAGEIIRGTGGTYSDTVHDHIFVNKLIYRLRDPQRGEVIVFKAERNADTAPDPYKKENVLIKRLIGVGGDTIEVKKDASDVLRVWRNGQPLNEPYIKEPMLVNGGEQFALSEKLTLKPDELFVMGDNRNNSNDSRYWGPLKRNRVIGKAMFVFWPLSRIRVIR